MVVAIILSSHFIQNGTWRVNDFLSESSLFIYAYHAIFLFKIQNVLVVKVLAASSTGLLATYFLSPTITILIGLGIYWTLKRFFPKFTNFITGER